MDAPYLLLVLVIHSFLPISSSLSALNQGQSLSAHNKDHVLISPNNLFSAGLYSIGVNAYSFAIWFTQPLPNGNHTIIWMANRDEPVNGKGSTLTLLKNGNLVLTDASRGPIWQTTITSINPSTTSVQLELMNNGNLVVTRYGGSNQYYWQSFDSPMDTLLPEQPLTKDIVLISSKSRTNYSSGYYKFRFDENNILRLSFNNLQVSSVYWPYAWQRPEDTNRTFYNGTRIAVLDTYGYFQSSDNLEFRTTDYGSTTPRRLTLDTDGVIRAYSLDQTSKLWEVTWTAISGACGINGMCGSNSLCTYSHGAVRKCSCVPGHKMVVPTDWSYGCEPDFVVPSDHNDTENSNDFGFLKLPHVDFYGYDSGFFVNYSLEMCKEECNRHANCKAFLYWFENNGDSNLCYTKTRMFNGQQYENFDPNMYVKLPTSVVTFYENMKNPLEVNTSLDCSSQDIAVMLDRTYKKKKPNDTVRFMLWFAFALGLFEIVCVVCFLFMQMTTFTSKHGGYLQVATGFRRFSYEELKKATRNFSEEIGRGGSSIVYKGVLLDDRVAAIKKFKQANCQGEAEFLAEVSTMGKLNHMNLMETWGYCVKGKNKFLVYEYQSNGSLAQNLSDNALDWEKRYEIAVGTAKGLAYLHEECLEWVLHCDVKPQNILLDSNYEPKVADFGLSKLLNRGIVGNDSSSFSKIRGTRGYMAPEWVLNQPVTSKVDVYSYGILVLEMITGKSPIGVCCSNGEGEEKILASWIKEKRQAGRKEDEICWIREIVDSRMKGVYDLQRMETLVKVALQCVEDDKDARPNMSQVVEMLVGNEICE